MPSHKTLCLKTCRHCQDLHLVPVLWLEGGQPRADLNPKQITDKTDLLLLFFFVDLFLWVGLL